MEIARNNKQYKNLYIILKHIHFINEVSIVVDKILKTLTTRM